MVLAVRCLCKWKMRMTRMCLGGGSTWDHYYYQWPGWSDRWKRGSHCQCQIFFLFERCLIIFWCSWWFIRCHMHLYGILFAYTADRSKQEQQCYWAALNPSDAYIHGCRCPELAGISDVFFYEQNFLNSFLSEVFATRCDKTCRCAVLRYKLAGTSWYVSRTASNAFI